MFHIKRVYEDSAPMDGYRVLVDRLWPRGVSKEKAALDLWLKEVAPSAALRIWFNHQPERFEEFRARYLEELVHNSATETLTKLAGKHKTVTLLYGAKDPAINHAVVLLNYIENHRN